MLHLFSLKSELEAVCNPPLTTPSLIAPSSPSTLRDNIAFIMTFPDPPFLLAQSTEFEVGETFSINEDDTCYESNNVFIEVHEFDATLVGQSYVDVVVIMPASPEMVDNISPSPLNSFHASSSYSLCSLSP